MIKKLLGILVLVLMWCNVGYADREYALEVLSRKFGSGVETFLLALVFGVIAFIISQLFKFLFKINIEIKYYYIIFMGVGVVLTKYLLQ